MNHALSFWTFVFFKTNHLLKGYFYLSLMTEKESHSMEVEFYSQPDRSLHRDHVVQEVQLVLVDHLRHLYQRGPQVQVVPRGVQVVLDYLLFLKK